MKKETGSGYEDILYLQHHVSNRHPRMPLQDRAAQFSPFAALTGHEAAIQEAARQTEEWKEPDEDEKALLDGRLQMLLQRLPEEPQISFTFFCPDEAKEGGAYRTVTGRVKRVDACAHRITMEDGTILPVEYIRAMEGSIFDE